MNHASMGQELSAKGRNGDSMLVHMTPEEVGGLQNLAMAAGGSLTINPETGLVEANFLKRLLPTLLGVGLNFVLPGSGIVASLGGKAATAGLLTGLGSTALTGNINKGLMAGLQAFGGASLGGALAGKGAAAAAVPTKTAAANILPGDEIAMQLAEEGTKQAVALPSGVGAGLGPGGASVVPSVSLPASTLPMVPAAAPVGAAKTGLAGFGQQFGQAARGTMTGFAGKAAPYAAGLGVLDAVNQASTPVMRMPEEEKSNYEGFFEYRPRTFGRREPYPGGETIFFDRVNPFVTSRGFAEGGEASSTGASAQAPASLSDLVAFFQTSPGAITASRTYPGGSTAGSTGPRDYGFRRSTGMSAVNTGGGGGGGGGGSGDGANVNNATNVGGSDQMGGTSTTNFVEGTQHLINQRDGVYSPGPPGPYTLNPVLPGTNLDAVKVSGDGVMPDFKLEDLKINPVDMSNSDLRVSNTPFTGNLGLGGGYGGEFGGAGGFGRELGFSGSGIYSSGLGGLNSMANFGSGLDPRYTGGNYNFLEQDYNQYFAKGGEVGMEDGSFVIDARTVSEIGNGSSNAGIEHLARMGGRPVRGRGDGVSDSVPARIGRDQEARVARDEVIFSPDAVARIGGGNHSKGTKKLYALMDKAHKARKKAGRGQDTKVAKGLGGLA